MKTPLRFQITEFDCGSVSLLNCLTYLFDREDIPAELIKAISTYTLDCYDEYGNIGQKGTSRQAVEFLSRWMQDYSRSKNFGIDVEYKRGSEVNIDDIKKCLNHKRGGVVNLRTYYQVEHYVTITAMDDQYVYVWDPYYCPPNEFDNDKEVDVILDHDFEYNRRISLRRFLSKTKRDFALGPVQSREILLIKKK